MRLSLISTAVVSAVVSVVAQDPVQPRQSTTFRTDARLVRVSVVVHDRRGEPVSGLSAADFELIEDGRPQSISLFAVEGTATQPLPTLPPNVVSNKIEGPSPTGVTLLLYDRLNTQWEHQGQAKAHIIKYLRQLKPRDRVGLYLLESDKIRVLHDFSRDVSSLIAALDRASSSSSRELAASEEAVSKSEPLGIAAIDALMEEWALRAERQLRGFATETRVKATAAAMETLARYLSGVRGRKNVIWISGGFPIRYHDGISMANASPDIYRATRALSDADIAFYPVDARGLVGVLRRLPPTENSNS